METNPASATGQAAEEPRDFESDSILLVLPVPFRHDREGRLLVEKQAANGLDRWAENFLRLVIACPLKPDNPAALSHASDDYMVWTGSRRAIAWNSLPCHGPISSALSSR